MIKLRVPCKEAFAFIEEDYEGDNPKGRYDELYALMNGKETPPEAFYTALQALFDSNLTLWGSADEYEALSPSQQAVLQSAKRYKKRLDNK